MRRQARWIVIPAVTLAALTGVSMVGYVLLHRPESPNPTGGAESAALTLSEDGQRQGGPTSWVRGLAEEENRRQLIPVAEQLESLAARPPASGDLVGMQRHQQALADLASELESTDPTGGEALEVKDRLKSELRRARVDAWTNQLEAVEIAIGNLRNGGNPGEQRMVLENGLAQLRALAGTLGEDRAGQAEARDRQRRVDRAKASLEKELGSLRPSAWQRAASVGATSVAVTWLALALSLAACTLCWRTAALGKAQRHRVQEVDNDCRRLKTELYNEVRRIDGVEKAHREIAEEMEQMRRASRPVPAERPRTGPLSRPERESIAMRAAAAPMPRADDAWSSQPLSWLEPPLPEPPPPEFLGSVAELQARVPANGKFMQYDPVSGMLLEAFSSSGFKYRVFADPGTQEVRVLPNVERASMQQELYALEPVFDLEGDGGGAVSLVQHPRLEPAGSGYRIVKKGRLQVG